MTIEWFDNRPRAGGTFVSVDRQQRLHISSDARRLLGVTEGLPLEVFLGYDKVNKRIAVGKPDIVRVNDSRPFRFDGKRYYAHGKSFIEEHQLPFDRAYRYYYDGKDAVTGALLFKLEDYSAPDAHNRTEPVKPTRSKRGKKAEE